MTGKIDNLKRAEYLGGLYGTGNAVLAEAKYAVDSEDAIEKDAARWIDLQNKAVKDRFIAGYHDGFKSFKDWMIWTRRFSQDAQMAYFLGKPDSALRGLAKAVAGMAIYLADYAVRQLPYEQRHWCFFNMTLCYDTGLQDEIRERGFLMIE